MIFCLTFLLGLVIGLLLSSIYKELVTCPICQNTGIWKHFKKHPHTGEDEYDSVICDCGVGQDLKKDGFDTRYAWWKRFPN